jgi:hypothetical protein
MILTTLRGVARRTSDVLRFHSNSRNGEDKISVAGVLQFLRIYAETKAIFYAGGPDFRERPLREVNNVDVAPTVADLLEIELSLDAQGKRISKF